MQNKNVNQPKLLQNHTITIENQAKAHLTGINEVITATEKGVYCKLASGNLQIAGENLRVEKLLPEEGNSTYRNKIIDTIYNMTGEELEKGAKYEIK